MIQQET